MNERTEQEHLELFRPHPHPRQRLAMRKHAVRPRQVRTCQEVAQVSQLECTCAHTQRTLFGLPCLDCNVAADEVSNCGSKMDYVSFGCGKGSGSSSGSGSSGSSPPPAGSDYDKASKQICMHVPLCPSACAHSSSCVLCSRGAGKGVSSVG
jgi:hypothetical protein